MIANIFFKEISVFFTLSLIFLFALFLIFQTVVKFDLKSDIGQVCGVMFKTFVKQIMKIVSAQYVTMI